MDRAYELARGAVAARRRLGARGLPVAGLPLETIRAGGELAIVNRGPTAFDGQASLRVDGSAGEVLPEVVAELRG